MMESDCTILGPRCKLLRLQESTQPCHRGYGVGGPLKTTTLITVLPASAATNTLHVYVREEKWAIVHRVVCGKESQIECAIVLCTRPLEIEVSADPECTPHSSIP